MVGFGKLSGLRAWVRRHKTEGAERVEERVPAAMSTKDQDGEPAFDRTMPSGRRLRVQPIDSSALTASAGAEVDRVARVGALLPDLEALKTLLASAGALEVVRYRNEPVSGLCDHSGRVGVGSIFFAIPGHEADGARFAIEAVGRGAVAVVAERVLPVPVPCFVVEDVRRASGLVAARFYGDPSAHLAVIGVTGTNGKTTVTDLLRLCLEDDGRPVGSLGTIEYRLGTKLNGREHVEAATNTTPGAIDVQRYLRAMLDRGCKHAVVEVSSHALDQGRVDAVRFAAALFTNLSRDHLDYHGTMQAYARSKARLFEQLGPGKLAVVPVDDKSALPIRQVLGGHDNVTSWALGSTRPDSLPPQGTHVRGEILRETTLGTRMRIRTRDGCVDVDLPLIGIHNARNALAAMAAAIALGVGPLRVGAAMARARPVKGRMEAVPGFDAFRVFVDYAHTPDALEQVLRALRPMTRGRLRVVFGCGGERDRGKRGRMGQIAATLADHVVVTHDNPRREDPEGILSDILAGVAELPEAHARVEVSADRRQAIYHVLDSADASDTILIAGKGHESGQLIGTTLHSFDDREVALEWLHR